MENLLVIKFAGAKYGRNKVVQLNCQRGIEGDVIYESHNVLPTLSAPPCSYTVLSDNTDNVNIIELNELCFPTY